VCGPLALVAAGDTITIDLDARRCDLEVNELEMQRRRAAWQAPPKQFDRGWLQIYRRNVGPLTQGAVLVKSDPDNTGQNGARHTALPPPAPTA
jgi:dihydroxy-acid dehydratase